MGVKQVVRTGGMQSLAPLASTEGADDSGGKMEVMWRLGWPKTKEQHRVFQRGPPP